MAEPRLPSKDPEEYDSKVRSGIRLDIRQLIFMAILECNKNLVYAPSLFPFAVRGLEVLLTPVMDKKFHDDRKEVDDNEKKNITFTSSVGVRDSNGKLLSKNIEDYSTLTSITYANQLYEDLIELAHRKGLYPMDEIDLDLDELYPPDSDN